MVVCSDHADGLPAWFAIDLAILRGDVVGIVEHVQRGIEADAVLPPVEPILPRASQVNSTAINVSTILYIHYSFLEREHKRKFTNLVRRE